MLKIADQTPQWSSDDMIGYLSCDFTATTLRVIRGSFDRYEVIVMVVCWGWSTRFGHELRMLENLVGRECRSDTWRDGIGCGGERTVAGGCLRRYIGDYEMMIEVERNLNHVFIWWWWLHFQRETKRSCILTRALHVTMEKIFGFSVSFSDFGNQKFD